MFFLKAEEKSDGEMRIRVFCELENGFVGLVDESMKQAQPHLWTKFDSKLKEFGKEEAEKIALEKGEFRLPEEPRELAVVEREYITTEEKLTELKAELAEIKKNEEAVEGKPKAKAKAKSKAKSKPKKVEIEEIENEAA